MGLGEICSQMMNLDIDVHLLRCFGFCLVLLSLFCFGHLMVVKFHFHIIHINLAL